MIYEIFVGILVLILILQGLSIFKVPEMVIQRLPAERFGKLKCRHGFHDYEVYDVKIEYCSICSNWDDAHIFHSVEYLRCKRCGYEIKSLRTRETFNSIEEGLKTLDQMEEQE